MLKKVIWQHFFKDLNLIVNLNVDLIVNLILDLIVNLSVDIQYIPYACHYNPRFVHFLPPFYFEVRFILQTIYVLKTKILHFKGLKSAVYTQERLLIKSGL
jgi:hypothetical protein